MVAARFAFGPFVVDTRAGVLTRAGSPVPLSPPAMDLLVRLIQEPGKVIPRRTPSPAPAAELRAALGEHGAWVEPLGDAGVRFTGPVRRLPSVDLPDRKGHFEILGLLGEGGMGQVYLVRHPVLGRKFALKLVTSPSAHLNERILQEARAQSSVAHPHVLEVLDVFEIDGRPALLLPLIEGPTLEAVFAQRGIDTDMAAFARSWFPVFRDVVEGVAAIHAAGLVHRDLKPSNVLLDVSGARVVPKISDFGVAKALADHRAANHLTGTGAALGTPAYAAPEQLQDAGAVDARADVFALGCILHDLATGAPPRRVGGRLERTPVDPVWDALLDRMLRVDPAARFQDAGAVLAALPTQGPAPTSAAALALARSLTPVPADPSALATLAPDSLATDHLGVPRPLPAGRSAGRPATAEPTLAGPSRRRLFVGGAAALAAVMGVGAAGAWVWLAGGPERGGTLRVGTAYARGPLGVDAAVNSGWTTVRRAVYDALLDLDEGGEARPGAVDRWTFPDDLHVELVLRGDLWFHDHPCVPGGRRATPQDLAWSIQRAVDRGLLSPAIGGAAVAGDRVVVTLTAASPFLLAELSAVLLLPAETASCAALSRTDDLARPCGTGPFRFTDDARGEVIELVRHERWWRRDADGGALPYLGELRVVSVPRDRGVEQVHAGEIDVFGPMDQAQVADAQGVQRVQSRGGWVGLKGILFLGTSTPVEVRRAIQAALDREAIAKTPDGGEIVPSDRYLSPEQLGYDPSLPPLGPDPAAARALLGPGPRALVLGAFASDWTVAEAVRDQLATVGIEVRTTRFTSQSLQRLEGAQEWLADAVVVEVKARVNGIDPYPMLSGVAGMVGSVGPSPGADLLAAAATEVDRSARQRRYGEIERAWRDDPRFVILGTLADAHLLPTWVTHPNVRGLEVDPLTFAEAWSEP